MPREFPTEMNADLLAILGRPNFACARLAGVLRRHTGRDIPTKTEAEQAHVLHWLLGLYLDHGEAWEAAANHQLTTWLDAEKSAAAVSA